MRSQRAASTLTPAAIPSSLRTTRLVERAGIMAYYRFAGFAPLGFAPLGFARCGFAVVAGLLSAGIAAVLAQDLRYPTRTISIVVANAAGGGTDYLARLVGQKLQDRL